MEVNLTFGRTDGKTDGNRLVITSTSLNRPTHYPHGGLRRDSSSCLKSLESYRRKKHSNPPFSGEARDKNSYL